MDKTDEVCRPEPICPACGNPYPGPSYMAPSAMGNVAVCFACRSGAAFGDGYVGRSRSASALIGDDVIGDDEDAIGRWHGPESIDFLLDDLPKVGYTGVERVLCEALIKARDILDAISHRDITWDQYEIFAKASDLRKEWKTRPGTNVCTHYWEPLYGALPTQRMSAYRYGAAKGVVVGRYCDKCGVQEVTINAND